MKNTIENAPALELDKVLYKDRPMPPHVKRERRIVWNLLKQLSAAGWNVIDVFDGEEHNKVDSPKAAMEHIFNLDDAWFYVNQDGRTVGKHWVRLVLGNDIDVVSDWSYTEGDPDGFNAAIDKFNAEDFA